ncbi:hypothetical protein T484DRAFT_1814983, partial [Baffinella frigidus]
HDSTIFSLALLLSSFFVYNSVGSIDEGALNNLSLVVNLTKHIHVRSSAQVGAGVEVGQEEEGAGSEGRSRRGREGLRAREEAVSSGGGNTWWAAGAEGSASAAPLGGAGHCMRSRPAAGTLGAETGSERGKADARAPVHDVWDVGGEDDGADFAQYFPSFLWLVRDFTLQLVTPDGQPFTSKEYLERALQPAPGFRSRTRPSTATLSGISRRSRFPFTSKEYLERALQPAPGFTEQIEQGEEPRSSLRSGPFTSKEYLERALQPAPGFTEQIEAKNRIRRMLTHFFPERDCFTMVRPVTDESLLQKLSETPSEKLRPEFREQMTQLKANIMGAAHPKMMHGTGLDGSALVNLAYAYTQSINTGSVPSIQNAWSYICESKCQVALGLALKGYEVASKNLIDKVLPVSETELEDQHLEMDKAAWAIFAKNAIGTDTEEWKRQLEDKIRELYKNLKTENANRGRQRRQREDKIRELDKNLKTENANRGRQRHPPSSARVKLGSP